MVAYATYPSLKGKTVFITGGASGIGAVMVRAFHAQGCKAAFVDLDEAGGHSLAGETGAWFRRCDVTDAAALEQAVRDAAADLGGLDVLVNLDPAFIASVAAYPLIKARGGGAIINFSSINALLGPAQLTSYVAAKGAINALSKSLAREWGADNIRVNAISPGWVVTQRQLELWLTPEAEAEWMKQVALQRRIQPEDVARLALFLASADSEMITGQNLVIDGGRT